jgi:predicted aconitase with swiveling domain
MVVLGSPHFSLAEFAQLAPLIRGKEKHPAVKFLVTSSRAMTQLAGKAGFPRGSGGFRRATHRGHLHPHIANAARRDQVPDDQFGKVRLLLSGAAGKTNQLRQSGGLRTIGSGGVYHSGGIRMGGLILQGRVIIRGEAQGEALVSREPLSFWGGYDWKTGEIIDRRHMLSGAVAAGKIFAVPFTRGSSTTTAVLLEAIRAKTAPAAITSPTNGAVFRPKPRKARRTWRSVLGFPNGRR